MPPTTDHRDARDAPTGSAADAGGHRFAGRVPRGVTPVVPRADQESVWDYPRPPRVEPVVARIRVVFDGIPIADTERALRVLETAGAPVYYVPPEDVRLDLLRRGDATTRCEWKGLATSWTIDTGRRCSVDAGWSYEAPTPPFGAIRGRIAFYASMVDEAWVGDERAQPQPGGFYGGWVTSRIVGPIKGEPGSWGW